MSKPAAVAAHTEALAALPCCVRCLLGVMEDDVAWVTNAHEAATMLTSAATAAAAAAAAVAATGMISSDSDEEAAGTAAGSAGTRPNGVRPLLAPAGGC
jgi:uncharacterized membrane protein